MKSKNRVYRILTVAAILLLALSLVGCGETAGKVLKKEKAAYAATPGVGDMTAALSMDANILTNAGDSTKTGSQLTLKLTEKLALSADPITASGTVDTDMTVAGALTRTSSDCVMAEENGKMAVYTKTNGLWSRIEMENLGLDVLADPAFQEKLAALTEDKAILAKDKVTIGDYRCWQVDVTLDGEILTEMMTKASGLLDTKAYGIDPASADWSKSSAAMSIFVDAKTHLPVKVSMDLAGLQEGINSMLENSAGGESVEITTYTAEISYDSFTPHAPAVVTEEMKDGAALTTRLLSGKSDNGDGTRTLYDTVNGALVCYTFCPPAELDVIEDGYNYLSIGNELMTEYATYTVVTLDPDDTNDTPQNYAYGRSSQLSDSLVPITQENTLPENEQTTEYDAPVGKFHVYTADFNAGGQLMCRYFCAWYSADEANKNYLMIECTNMTSDGTAMSTEEFAARYLANATTYAGRKAA